MITIFIAVSVEQDHGGSRWLVITNAHCAALEAEIPAVYERDEIACNYGRENISVLMGYEYVQMERGAWSAGSLGL